MIEVMLRKEKSQPTHDYEPFGVEIPPYNESASNSHKFTGHERDAGTDYDYMHFRYYASTIGRFMKPDNVTGSPLNPQNWNFYSYVRGNPVNMNDPTGHQGEDERTYGGPEVSGGEETNPQGDTPETDSDKQEQKKAQEEKKDKPPEGAEQKENFFQTLWNWSRRKHRKKRKINCRRQQ